MGANRPKAVTMMTWCLGAVLALSACADVLAQEEGGRRGKRKGKGKGKTVTLQGMVQRVAGPGGELKSVRLAVSETEIYEVVQNPKGKALGEEMNGRKVEVSGMVLKPKGESKAKRLRVKKYKEVAVLPIGDDLSARDEEAEVVPAEMDFELPALDDAVVDNTAEDPPVEPEVQQPEPESEKEGDSAEAPAPDEEELDPAQSEDKW